MQSRRSLLVVVALGTVLAASWTASPALAGITDPAPLRATSAGEQIPSSGGGYLAWAQWGRSEPSIELERPDGTLLRVNPGNTFGWPGGFDGKRLAYQQATLQRSDSNIFLYNVKTGRTRGFPASVNSLEWEWGPTISGDLVLFGRTRQGHHMRILLFDRRTSELQQLAGPVKGLHLLAGQLNGRFAVWTHATGDGWDVVRYDTVTGSTTRIPRPDGVFAQYAPSVTADGTVYFASGARACGKDVAIHVRPIGGPTTTLFTLPARHDLLRTYADQSGTETQVVYDPGTCMRFGRRAVAHQDIWGFGDLGGAITGTGNPVGGSSSGSGGAPRSIAVPWAGFVRR